MKLYWIAINGPSCALSPFPLEFPKVIPRPEILFGFHKQSEAKEAQAICLQGSIEQVRRAMLAWTYAKGVSWTKLTDPEPPTNGPTLWTEETDIVEIPF